MIEQSVHVSLSLDIDLSEELAAPVEAALLSLLHHAEGVAEVDTAAPPSGDANRLGWLMRRCVDREYEVLSVIADAAERAGFDDAHYHWYNATDTGYCAWCDEAESQVYLDHEGHDPECPFA